MRIRRSPLLIAFALLGATVHAVPPPKPEQTEWIEKKLENIVIPRLEFREIGIVEAVEFLRKKAVELDPLRAGVPIYLRMQPTAPAQPPPAVGQIPGLRNALPPSPADARITVSLTNIPLSEALRYVSSLAGLKFRVMSDGVYVVPADDPEPLYDREFVLGPILLETLRQVPTEVIGGGQPQAPIADMKTYLLHNGVQFPNGAATTLDESKTRLSVRNTVERLDLIEIILGQNHPEPEPPVPVPGPEVPKVIWSYGGEIPPDQHKARLLALGRVSIVNATLREAVETLKQLGVQNDRQPDPADRGISIIIKLETADSARDISGIPRLESPPNTPRPIERRLNYFAQNVSFAEAAKAIAELAGMKVRYEPYAVMFVNDDEPERLVTVEYLVPPESVGRAPKGEVKPNTASDKVTGNKDWLLSSGVQFAPTTSAVYISASRKLVVRDTLAKQNEVRALTEKAWKEYYEAHPPTPASQAPATPTPAEAVPQ